MSSLKPLRVLIAGSGIAGSSFARCLLHAYKDADITIVEKAPGLRLSGASVDVRSNAVDIVKWMGIEPEIRQNSTHETGTRFVRADGSTVAYFGATGNAERQSMTSEYEIFRGALANILLRPTLDKIELIYDETVESYQQTDDQVSVTFSNSKKTEYYDLLVAADGIGSKIRGQMLNARPRDHIRDTGCRISFFTAPRNMLDGSSDGAWRAMPEGKSVFLRPDPSPEGRTRCHFLLSIPDDQAERRERVDEALAAGNESFMTLLEEEFKGGDWLTQETLVEMRRSTDFYASFFAQVRAPRLQDGRVVLLGDAGYATPGIGTSLAITGGYVLAGELLRTSCDVEAALRNYEQLLVPYLKKEQISFDPIKVLSPQSQWAISLRDTVLWIITKLRLVTMMEYTADKLGIQATKLQMPDYAWPANADM